VQINCCTLTEWDTLSYKKKVIRGRTHTTEQNSQKVRPVCSIEAKSKNRWHRLQKSACRAGGSGTGLRGHRKCFGVVEALCPHLNWIRVHRQVRLFRHLELCSHNGSML
jgi:hypothetical protein